MKSIEESLLEFVNGSGPARRFLATARRVAERAGGTPRLTVFALRDGRIAVALCPTPPAVGATVEDAMQAFAEQAVAALSSRVDHDTAAIKDLTAAEAALDAAADTAGTAL